MKNSIIADQRNMNEVACESKHTCFYIKNYGTLCPNNQKDLSEVGIYYPPTPEAQKNPDCIQANVFHLNRLIHIESSPEDKSIHISIHLENGVWRVGLIPGYAEKKKLSALYSSNKSDSLFKICRETKLALSRRKSALRICKSVLAHQRAFFHNGIESIKPLSLLDVAVDVSLDESCISRYSNKIILHTPHGTIKLRYLFNRQGYTGKACSQYSKIAIQMKMKKIVEHEGDRNKISDRGISGLLKKDGIEISRRAVTKYRLEMGIPSSRERRCSYTG